MKINLEKLEVFTDLSKKNCIVVDIREQMANLIYNNGQGLVCSVLAHKLYENHGEVELDDNEVEALRSISEKILTPSACEAVLRQLDTPNT